MNKMQQILSKYPKSQIFVLTDEHVAQLLPMLGLSCYPTLALPAGEEHKTLAMTERVWRFLLEHEATRSALLVNVGGGVVTDLGGFAASTYKRGIDYVNIPTTLLAMVDAASGGKTGIDYDGLKNVIGLFRAPVRTIIDTRLLATLPARELLSGYAEMLKHALIADAEEWKRLLALDIDTLDPTAHAFRERIVASMAIKDRIVAADPEEKGLRKALNFGHTIGHALESLSIETGGKDGARVLTHGEAVLYGLVAELYLSHVQLGLPSEVITQLSHCMVENYGRINVSCRRYERLLEIMQQDKKNASPEAINFTLLKQVGDPVINRIASRDEIFEALDYLFSL